MIDFLKEDPLLKKMICVPLFMLLTFSVSHGRPGEGDDRRPKKLPHSIRAGMGNIQLRVLPIGGGYFDLISRREQRSQPVQIDRGSAPALPAAQTLGYWHMINNRVKLGADLGLRVDTREVSDLSGTENADGELPQKQVTSTDFIFAPGIRYYTRRKSSTALYILAQFNLRVFDDGDANTTDDESPSGNKVFNPDEAMQLGLLMGFGAEWFPAKRFSISGELGLDFSLARPGTQGFALGTYLSALSANLYF